MAFNGTDRCRVTIAFIAAHEIAVSSCENRIFMDCGISHIQHITGINGDCEEDTFRGDSATCRAFGRSTSNQKLYKNFPRFDQDSPLKHLTMYVLEFEVSRFMRIFATRAEIIVLVRGI